jgi:hypothetical protein
VRAPPLRLAALGIATTALIVSALVLTEPPRPYVVTAIDYHFHDAHPTFPIASGRDLVVKNAGRNPHNVSIPALGVVEDIAPDEELVIPDPAGRLEPGRYELFCRFHLDRGMTGTIVIAD